MKQRASYKIALVQMDSQDNEIQNMEKAASFVRQAANQGAELIIFPETVDYIGKGLKYHAKPVPGEWDAFFSGQAKKYGVYIHGGSITEQNKTGNPWNTSLMFAPDGGCIARYRKVHMFDVEVAGGPSYRESHHISAGSEVVLADTELGKMGLAICYDLRFPELFRIQSMQGAELLILAANFTHATGEKHWKPLLQARAIENTCYVLACDQCGRKPAFTAHGHSMIIDPMGEVIVEGGMEECCLIDEIDPDRVVRAREQIPSLKNIRRDVYQLSFR